MDEFWGTAWPFGPQLPAATDAEIEAWQKRFGVRLPPTLAVALQVQNGGSIRGTDLLIYPLSQITPLTGIRWAQLMVDETNRAFGDAGRLVLFGMYEEFPASLILNYNADPIPRVIVLWHDLADELRDEDDGSFDDLIRRSRERKW